MFREIDAVFDGQHDKARRLGSYGWTFPMWGPLHFLTLMPEDVTVEALDTYFVEKYSRFRSKELRQVLRETVQSPWLLRWHPLLEQAVYAFRRRRYLVAVPALLLVLEGVLLDVAGQFQERVAVPRAAARIREAEGQSIVRAGWATVEGFVAGVFRHADFGASRPELLNRHWVLHGRDVPGWSRVDCLRLLQALHTISTLRDSRDWRVDPA